MPMHKVNARDLIFEVSDMQATPVWVGVGGLVEAGVDPSANEAAEDTTTYDSQGYYEQEIMQRGATLTLSGRVLMDPDTGARDPGQALLNEHAEKVGSASQVDVRFRYPPEQEWTVWRATITRGSEAGGQNAKVPFSYTITRCGAPSTAAVV